MIHFEEFISNNIERPFYCINKEKIEENNKTNYKEKLNNDICESIKNKNSRIIFPNANNDENNETSFKTESSQHKDEYDNQNFSIKTFKTSSSLYNEYYDNSEIEKKKKNLKRLSLRKNYKNNLLEHEYICLKKGLEKSLAQDIPEKEDKNNENSLFNKYIFSLNKDIKYSFVNNEQKIIIPCEKKLDVLLGQKQYRKGRISKTDNITLNPANEKPEFQYDKKSLETVTPFLKQKKISSKSKFQKNEF